MDSTNKTHLPGIYRAPASGTSVVGKIATAAKMICLYVLMVVGTACLDSVGRAIPVVEACPSPSAWEIFHVAPSSGRDSVERHVQKLCLANRVDLVQFGGHVTKPEDPNTTLRNRGSRARHVRQHRLLTATEPTKWRAKLEEAWRPTTPALVMFPTEISQTTQDREFARSVRVRDAARRSSFIVVETDQRLRRAAASASRPDRLMFEPGDLCCFWRDTTGWSPGMATVVSQVGQGHCSVDYGGRIFEQSAEQLAHVTEKERERLAQDALRESQEPGQDTDPATGQPEPPLQLSQSTEPAPNSDAPIPEQQPDVSMQDQDSPEPGDPVNNVEPSESDHEEH